MTTSALPEAKTGKTSCPVSNSRLWTAARCQRLLRPIQSRLELLKRFPSLDSCAVHSENEHGKRTHLKRAQEPLDDVGDWQKGAAPDDEWKPLGKRQRRTYSGRSKALLTVPDKVTALQRCYKAGSRNASPLDVTNQTCISTPLLRRSSTADSTWNEAPLHHIPGEQKAKDWTCQDIRSHRTSSIVNNDVASVDVVGQLQRRTSPARFSLYVGLLKALRVLLVATRPIDRPTQQMDRSLMSIALRFIPKQIQEEERLARSSSLRNGVTLSPGLPDAASRMYAELEQYGYSGRDWQRLQTVVRADGLQRICTVIEDDHLDTSLVRVLVHFCARYGSTREAEVILQSSLRMTVFAAPLDRHAIPIDDLSMLGISILEECLEYPHFQDVYLRRLRHVFSTGALPIAWAATGHFDLMWTELFKSIISRSSVEGDALLMLLLSMIFRETIEIGATGIDQACSRSLQKSFPQLYETVLRTLLTIVILQNDPVKLSSHDTAGRRILQAARKVLRQNYADCGVIGTWPETTSGWILLTSVVLLDSFELHESNSSIKCDQLTNLFSTLEPQSNDSSSHDLTSALNSCSAFVCSVAHSCGKVDASGGLKYLESMLEQMLTLLSADRHAESTFFGDLITDCAYLFAEQQPCVRNLAFAEVTGLRAVSSSSKIRKAPSTRVRQSPDKYRWEDGISEWVAITPRVSSSSVANLETGSGGRHMDDTPIKDVLQRYNCSTIVCPSNAAVPKFSAGVIEDDITDWRLQLSATAIRIGVSTLAPRCQDFYQESRELSDSAPANHVIPIMVESVTENKLSKAPYGQAEHDDSGDELGFSGSICRYSTTRANHVLQMGTCGQVSDHILDACCHPQNGAQPSMGDDSEDELCV